jgi:hypothetical protein
MVSNFVHIGRLLTRAPEGVDCNENKGFNEVVR